MTQLHLSIYRQGTVGEALLWTLSNTCDQVRPITLRDYQDRARWLMDVLGADTGLADVTYQRLLNLARERGPKAVNHTPLLNVTVKKRLILLHRAFSDAEARGLIAACPKFPKLHDDGAPGKRIHTPEQFAAMRAQLKEPWSTWVTVAWHTAMRPFDVNRAREHWFDPHTPFRSSSGTVAAPGSWLRHAHKTDPDDRDLCWLPMEQEFADWMASRTVRGGGPNARMWRPWWKAVARMALACERAGVPRISPIDLRRSRASIWVVEGKSDEWIRVALGHAGYSRADGSQAGRPTIRSRHYYRPTADLLAGQLPPLEPPPPPAPPGGAG